MWFSFFLLDSHRHTHGWLIGRKRRWIEGDADLEITGRNPQMRYTQAVSAATPHISSGGEKILISLFKNSLTKLFDDRAGLCDDAHFPKTKVKKPRNLFSFSRHFLVIRFVGAESERCNIVRISFHARRQQAIRSGWMSRTRVYNTGHKSIKKEEKVPLSPLYEGNKKKKVERTTTKKRRRKENLKWTTCQMTVGRAARPDCGHHQSTIGD